MREPHAQIHRNPLPGLAFLDLGHQRNGIPAGSLVSTQALAGCGLQEIPDAERPPNRL
jgi:hypothetical protein